MVNARVLKSFSARWAHLPRAVSRKLFSSPGGLRICPILPFQKRDRKRKRKEERERGRKERGDEGREGGRRNPHLRMKTHTTFNFHLSVPPLEGLTLELPQCPTDSEITAQSKELNSK